MNTKSLLKIFNKPGFKSSLMLQFFTGGMLVAITTFLVEYVSPTTAAIMWAFPFSLIPTIFFLWHQGVSLDKITSYIFSTSVGLVALLIFILSYSYSAKYVPYIKNSKNGPLYALAIALVFWSMGAIVMYILNVGEWF
jgi:hypothetical protein